MKKFAPILLALLIVVALGAAGCGKDGGGSSSGTTITMSSDNFSTATASAKAGDTVQFVDPATAAEHILCFGEGGTCAANADGPSDLNSGSWTFQPGDTKSVTFAKAGTYHITCTIHPQMNMVLTVS
jgi:plastocyanin